MNTRNPGASALRDPRYRQRVVPKKAPVYSYGDEEPDDNYDASDCPACGHENEQPMGILGNRKHYRCRACGLDYSEVLR